MYSEPNHDSAAIRQALGGDLATAGLFCAGEIGPLGVKGIGSSSSSSSSSCPTYLHGFTSVVALMYDTGVDTEAGEAAGGEEE